MAYATPEQIAEYEKNKPDICEHHILRTSCMECPQAKPQKSAAEIKAMFACRNAITLAMDAFVAYEWTDPQYGNKLDGACMGLMMLKLAKRAWTPTQEVFELARHLAKSVGRDRNYVAALQRAAVESKILKKVYSPGKGYKRSRLGAPIFLIDYAVIDEFRKKDELTKEVEAAWNRSKRKPVDPEDAAEENRMFEAEDLCGEDNCEEPIPEIPGEAAAVNGGYPPL